MGNREMRRENKDGSEKQEGYDSAVMVAQWDGDSSSQRGGGFNSAPSSDASVCNGGCVRLPKCFPFPEVLFRIKSF